MINDSKAVPLSTFFHRAGLAMLVASAIFMMCLSVAALTGVMPWLNLPAQFGVHTIDIGVGLQLGLTGLLVILMGFVPSAHRTLQIETQQREFRVSMDDVSRAYQMSHAADRSGAFSLSREFDDIRVRMEHLLEHPDLRKLEPDVIELAAQMSRESRDLAEIYSDEKVSRARTFLQQRQEELSEFRAQIDLAQRTCDELKRWQQELSVEDAAAEKSRARLEEDLKELLDDPNGLGMTLPEIPTARNVVAIPPDAKRKDTARKRASASSQKSDKAAKG